MSILPLLILECMCPRRVLVSSYVAAVNVNVVTGADEAEEARLLSGLARTSDEGQPDRQSADRGGKAQG